MGQKEKFCEKMCWKTSEKFKKHCSTLIWSNFGTWSRILERLWAVDLILHENFDPWILLNSKKLWIIMQRCYIRYTFYDVIGRTYNFVQLGKICGSKFPRKIGSPIARWWLLPLVCSWYWSWCINTSMQVAWNYSAGTTVNTRYFWTGER